MKKIEFTSEILLSLPKSRNEAIQLEQKYFFSGDPCKNGHLSPRSTKNNYCVICQRESIRLAAERRRRKNGMMLMKDREVKPLTIGERFKKLTAMGELKIKYSEKSKRNNLFHVVKCDCGVLLDLRAGSWGITSMCKTCVNSDSNLKTRRVLSRIENSELKGKSGTVKGRLFQAAKKRAKSFGREFNLSIEDIHVPDKCPVLGITLEKNIFKERIKFQSANDNSPSLDRIDSSKGYTKENIQVLSYRANSIKNDGTAYEHLLISKYLNFVQQGLIKRYKGINHAPVLSEVTRNKKNDWTLNELEELPRTRGEAIEKDKNHYFSGKLCKFNHLSPRRINGKCRQCCNERDNKRYKKRTEGAIRVIRIDEIIENENLHMSIEEAKRANVKHFFPDIECDMGHRSAWFLLKRNEKYYPKCLLCHRGSKSKFATNAYIKKGYVNKNLSNSISGFLYTFAKRRANKIGRSFDLKLEDIIIPKYCPIFGTELNLKYGSSEQNNESRANIPSLDRIDNNKGYTKSNILVISYRANIVKGQGTVKEHELIAKHMFSCSSSNLI